MPALYACVLACWVVMAVYWNYAAYFLYRDSCVVLCRAIAGIPVLKVIVLIFGVAFWTTCSNWAMCSFWMGVSLLNTHLVYETGAGSAPCQ